MRARASSLTGGASIWLPIPGDWQPCNALRQSGIVWPAFRRSPYFSSSVAPPVKRTGTPTSHISGSTGTNSLYLCSFYVFWRPRAETTLSVQARGRHISVPLARHAGRSGRGACNASRRNMVSAAGFEPTAPGFIPLRLSPPPSENGVRGLDCPFTLGPKADRCRPSSLYTFPARPGLARDRHDTRCQSVPRI
ncbi:hypothetical protein C7453_106146 [Gluconacetobacter liquefaciens]|uniref:Uncharacterized protein n=1 Tax=Gluconacetobacter liquefaciens TaxID=89584 RepID=A0A370G5V5_GLULI|nr:hypothetical protein C7453_106146 [Gluconacetobacter liquefaciens]